MAKIEQMRIDYRPIWRDYNYWKQDIERARTESAATLESDRDRFKAQAATLGHSDTSDYYTRGYEGIQADYEKREAEIDRDWQDLQSGATMGFLKGEGDIAIGVRALGDGTEFHTYGMFKEQYGRFFNTAAHALQWAEIDDPLGTDYSKQQEQEERERQRYERIRQEDTLETGGQKFEWVGEDPISMEEYYTRILGEVGEDPAVVKAREKYESSVEARKQAGQSVRGGGEAFTNVVPIEEESDEDEVVGWWS